MKAEEENGDVNVPVTHFSPFIVATPISSIGGLWNSAWDGLVNELREMGFKRVIAGYFDGNIGSLKVMEKCGMHPNGHSADEEYRGKTLKCYECEMEL